MTAHEKLLFFEILQLLRKTAANLPDFKGADWKDADDYIFSELNLTEEDVEQIYDGHDDLVYTGSCIPGPAPAVPSFEELAPFCEARTIFVCHKEVRLSKSPMRLCAMLPGSPIVLTEADCPELKNQPDGKLFKLVRIDRTSICPAEFLFLEVDNESKALFSVSEAQ